MDAVGGGHSVTLFFELSYNYWTLGQTGPNNSYVLKSIMRILNIEFIM